MNDINTLRF